MSINNVKNNSVNFGMKCPPRIKTQIADCLPTELLSQCRPHRLFKNSVQAADEIDIIGSKNTSLEKFNIVRHIGENFFDGATEVWDECRLLFKMLTPKGNQEKVTARINSGLAGEPLADFYHDFIKITKMAEEEFLSGHMAKQAEKGNLKYTAKGLLEMYPEHTEYICKEYNRPELKSINEKAQKLKETPVLKRIVTFFTGE